MKKHIVIGLGEIGNPILKLIKKQFLATGYDVNYNLMNNKEFEKLRSYQTTFAHICIPFSSNFEKSILNVVNDYNPKCVVIHSTIRPYTTEKLQNKLNIPVIYSATRGVHKRMIYDLKRYTKFYALEPNAPNKKWASLEFSKTMNKCGIKTKKMSKPIVLELAKIVVDTSYYGWLINYAQLSKMIADENNVDYNEMWMFADEIHKFLNNRPKMFPGFIGGHCVIPNLDLIKNETLNLIKEINSDYYKILQKRKKKIKHRYV